MQPECVWQPVGALPSTVAALVLLALLLVLLPELLELLELLPELRRGFSPAATQQPAGLGSPQQRLGSCTALSA